MLMAEDPIDQHVAQLRERIKTTSTVGLNAGRRVRLNYKIANLTVVVLSLWAILIAFVPIFPGLAQQFGINEVRWQAAGVILPVFIVVFSLIEGGDSFLRAHQL